MASSTYYGDDGYQAYAYGDDNHGINDTGTNHSTNTSGHDTYDPYSDYDYEFYGDDPAYETFYHRVFPFEEFVYLYVWPLLVILTTITNGLVILVLMGKNMRTSTNIILIAIAMSDTLTGVVTLPAYIHAYRQRSGLHLQLSRFWCEYFMVTKLFLTRAFHTISVWLTLVLGFQRLISVSCPFRAQSMFSITKTLIMIGFVFISAPVLHIYQLTEEKTWQDECGWHLKEPCEGGCVYIWVTFYLAHFIPCLLLVSFTVIMVIKLRKATEKMTHANMISNEANMRRRNAENRRISLIVIVIVILFLVPEIPYSIYLVLNVSLHHARKAMPDIKHNRAFVCTYEVLMVLSFHANFWVYLIMNRKFRQGLKSMLPCIFDACSALFRTGSKSSDKNSRRQSVTSGIRTLHSDVPSGHHSPQSDETTSKAVEMKLYNFDENGRNVPVSG